MVRYTKHTMQTRTRGFTVVELLIVIVIISIIITLAVFSYLSVQGQSRDSQRASNISALSDALEKYYEKNGEYPSCSDLRTSPKDTLPDLDAQTLMMPNNSAANAVVCTHITSSTTSDVISYVSSCSSGSSCQSWTLRYKQEDGGEIVATKSQRNDSLADRNKTVLSAYPSARTVRLSWTATAGASSYRLERSDSNLFLNITAGTYSTTSAVTPSLISSSQYYFRVRPMSGSTVMGSWSNVVSVTIP